MDFNMTKDEAMKLALEALDNLMYWDNGKPEYDEARQAITALREALALVNEVDQEQPAQQQEPDYAWPTVSDYEKDVGFEVNQAFKMAWNMARTTNKMLDHTSPPAQRTWVGLTDEEIDVAWNNCEAPYGFAEDIEAKLKEKNCG